MRLTTKNIQSPFLVPLLALLFIIFLWEWTLTPVFLWQQEQEEQLQKKIQQISRLKSLQGQQQYWSDTRKLLQQNQHKSMLGYYQNSTATQAQADFQLLLEQLIKNNHLKLKIKRLDTPVLIKNKGDKLSIWLHIESEHFYNIISFLNDMATQEKIILVEKFSIANLSKNNKLLMLSVIAYRYNKAAYESQEE